MNIVILSEQDFDHDCFITIHTHGIQGFFQMPYSINEIVEHIQRLFGEEKASS